jgi:uncharacterized protein YjbI with pentapeptide repeats
VIFLAGADLSDADLRRSYLEEANLSGANLSDAENWTEEQLQESAYINEATMPNGQKFEVWIKDR